MRLGTAIECLVDNYKCASDKEWINDKVAWALYHTWKEADEHRAKQTEPQTRTDEDGRVWDYRNGNWWQLGKTENNSEKPNNCEVSEIPTGSIISKMEQVEPQTCSFSDCDNFKNPDYERCIECKRKQIKLKTEQTEREGE